jgi:DNA-binding winged helix-turn-helix (wHTH) protein/Tfp pilus assembly protein PilF
MEMESVHASEFWVGDWHAKPSTNRLQRAGEDIKIKIEPRTMDVLAYLAAHNREVVSVDELKKNVWKGHVTDSSVYRAITILRQTLDGDASSGCYIETIPKRGYRINANVEFQSAQPRGEGALLHVGSRDAPRFAQRLGYILAASVALALIGTTIFWSGSNETQEALPTESPDAYAAYLKAMAVVQEGIVGPPVGNRLVVQNFLDEALEHDPRFALAHAWKADVYLWSSVLDPVPEETKLYHKLEMERLANEHAEMALELDPNIGFAHLFRARSHFISDRDEQGRLEEQQALRLSPNDPEVLKYFAFGDLRDRAQLETVIQIRERIVELEPHFSESYALLGWTLLVAGRPDDAKEAFQKCLSLDPTASGCTRELAQAEYVLGEYDSAFNGLRRAEQLSSSGPYTPAMVTFGYGLLERSEDAQRTFERVRESATDQYVDPGTWALAYLGVGEHGEALAQLNAAVKNQELPPDLQHYMRFIPDIVYNTWSHPTLEEPAFLEVRERLRANW